MDLFQVAKKIDHWQGLVEKRGLSDSVAVHHNGFVSSANSSSRHQDGQCRIRAGVVNDQGFVDNGNRDLILLP